MNYLSVALSKILLGIIFVYRYAFSGLFGGRCRFVPTCSQYAADAIKRWGPVTGTKRSLVRICKCHPFGPHGYDPVEKLEQE